MSCPCNRYFSITPIAKQIVCNHRPLVEKSTSSNSTFHSSGSPAYGTFEEQILQHATDSRPANIIMTVLEDYNPRCREKLVLRKGQRVKVLYKNDNWVYAVTKIGEAGYVPYNIFVDLKSMLDANHNHSMQTTSTAMMNGSLLLEEEWDTIEGSTQLEGSLKLVLFRTTTSQHRSMLQRLISIHLAMTQTYLESFLHLKSLLDTNQPEYTADTVLYQSCFTSTEGGPRYTGGEKTHTRGYNVPRESPVSCTHPQRNMQRLRRRNLPTLWVETICSLVLI